jgi:hypothetical protein
MTCEQVDNKNVNKRKEKFNKQNTETKKKQTNKIDVGCNYKGLLNVATKDVRCSSNTNAKNCKVSNCKAWNLIM